MSLRYIAATVVVSLTVTLMLTWPAESCNELVCASIVGKCLLTQACRCDYTNCTCCKECSTCLSNQFQECCSCVGMCPKPIDKPTPLEKESSVGDLEDSIPGLFAALTEEPDFENRWVSFTFPIDYDITLLNHEIKFYLKSSNQKASIPHNTVTLNCTVAYMSECMGLQKCKTACGTMGAAEYRWFHDGCCECMSNTCLNYGIKENRCYNCPPMEIDSVEEDDYGEDEYIEDY